MSRAVFVGCARNCAVHLPGVLSNVERIGGLFDDWTAVFVENDSTDLTKSLLSSWGRAEVISRDGLAHDVPIRTMRIAAARNAYLERLRQSDFKNFDYVIVLDLDDSNAEAIDCAAVKEAVAFLDQDAARGAVFTNQRGIYYDLWALRHPLICPGDIWEEALLYAEVNGASEQEAFAQTVRKRVFTIPPTNAPFEVDSAFGGLGIYKLPAALAGRYVGDRWSGGRHLQVCEHVAFHHDLRQAGWRLSVLPPLTNRTIKRFSYPMGVARSIVIA